MTIDIAAALAFAYPGAQWSLDGEEYTGLSWSENNQIPQPTEAEIATAYQNYLISKEQEPLPVIEFESFILVRKDENGNILARVPVTLDEDNQPSFGDPIT